MNWLVLVASATPSPSATNVQQYVGNPSKVTPGLVGALIFVLLLGAAYVLFRSLNKQLKKVPDSFDEPGDGASSSPPPSGS